MVGNDWSQFQAFLELDYGIYSIACLPARGSGDYPSASRLLSYYNKVLEDILAFTCNKSGVEYCVLFPQATNDKAKKKIVDIFIQSRNAGVDKIWTNTNFENQNPKYICNPKIWFYENNRPQEE